MKTQTSKELQYDTAGYENSKPLCGKRETHAHNCGNQLRCRQLGGRGTQKLAAKSLQTNITLEI